MQHTVVLIAPDQDLCSTLHVALESVGDLACHHVRPTEPRIEFLDSLADVPLVILHVTGDWNGADPVALVREIKRRHSACIFFVVLEERHLALECEFYREGVLECLDRPLDVRRLTLLIDLATIKARSQVPLVESVETADALDSVECLGSDGSYLVCLDSMKKLVQEVRAAVETRATILLTGETGTGKTALAMMIHELSPWSDQPFAVINCGTMTSTLVESEIFGHKKGAFTGAVADRQGKLAAAGHGSLMIDEIDSLPLTAQARLLRAVDERRFEQIGSNTTKPVHARLIVATNCSLEDEVKAGRFRSDLYYRINVVSLHLPSLRDRRPLIKPLALKFIKEFAARYGRRTDALDPRALQILRDYPWPGNIRQLRNVIERAIATSDVKSIGLEQLPEELRVRQRENGAAPPIPQRRPAAYGSSDSSTAKAEEADTIRDALNKNRNNRARTARELGISRVTLYKKLHKYGFI